MATMFQLLNHASHDFDFTQNMDVCIWKMVRITIADHTL